jgi:arylsulfatase A-like enzyme
MKQNYFFVYSALFFFCLFSQVFSVRSKVGSEKEGDFFRSQRLLLLSNVLACPPDKKGRKIKIYMKRIYLLFFLIFSLCFLTVKAQKVTDGIKPKQPNIIFILTDDLGYGDIGVFYQNPRKKAKDRSEPWTSTPNIDHLAAQGAMLPQHYCGAPVCAPARASLLLGVSQGHANVRDNQFDKALENNHTLASVLHKAGYTTAAFGKWGLQGLDNEGPDWPAHPLNRGFDYYLGYMRHKDGHEHYPKEGPYGGPKEVWENRTNIAAKLDKCYTADLWTAAAKKWIIDFKKDNAAKKPFFMYLAYETPHAILQLPTQPYPAGGGVKGGLQWLGEAGHMINTASGKIDSWIHPDYANATYDDDKNSSTPEIPWPNVYKRYATDVRRIDDAVGDLMLLLKDLKIDDNTLVIFSSDNGPSIESYLPENYAPDFFNSFGPFDGIKRDLWEGGVRVPTIATWPGHIPKGSVIQTPSAVYDWLPTLADAAGYPAPARTDGVSLLPSLTHIGKQRKSLVYIEYFQNQSTPEFKEFDPQHRNRKRNQMQLIRSGDTLGVRYNIQSHSDDFEIYNVRKDPQESRNLARNPGMDVVQKMMKEKVLQVRRPDTGAARPYDEEFVPAITNLKTQAGVKWKAYNHTFPWIPDVSTLGAVASGIAKSPDARVYKFTNNGLLYFEGYLKIPKDGEYTFSINADYGAFFRIHEATVIDEDFGYAGGTERAGTIRLKGGLHPYKLYFSVKKGNKHLLDFKWEGEGIDKQTIPSNAFYY